MKEEEIEQIAQKACQKLVPKGEVYSPEVEGVWDQSTLEVTLCFEKGHKDMEKSWHCLVDSEELAETLYERIADAVDSEIVTEDEFAECGLDVKTEEDVEREKKAAEKEKKRLAEIDPKGPATKKQIKFIKDLARGILRDYEIEIAPNQDQVALIRESFQVDISKITVKEASTLIGSLKRLSQVVWRARELLRANSFRKINSKRINNFIQKQFGLSIGDIQFMDEAEYKKFLRLLKESLGR